MQNTIGYAIDDDDMHWEVVCPSCGKRLEYEGYFDSMDINECDCGCSFLTDRVIFEDDSFIE